MTVFVENQKKPRPIDGNRVYIGRPGPYGNPFHIGSNGSREEVIEKYRAYISRHPELVEKLAEEKPDVLVCYCYPLACHGDVLVELLEKR